MHPDVTALLAVQDDDVTIHELETRLAALRPRLDAMAKERDKALAALAMQKRAVFMARDCNAFLPARGCYSPPCEVNGIESWRVCGGCFSSCVGWRIGHSEAR